MCIVLWNIYEKCLLILKFFCGLIETSGIIKNLKLYNIKIKSQLINWYLQSFLNFKCNLGIWTFHINWTFSFIVLLYVKCMCHAFTARCNVILKYYYSGLRIFIYIKHKIYCKNHNYRCSNRFNTWMIMIESIQFEIRICTNASRL